MDKTYRVECTRLGVLRFAGTMEQARGIAAQIREDVQSVGIAAAEITISEAPDCAGTQYMSHALSVGMFDACEACGTDNR